MQLSRECPNLCCGGFTSIAIRILGHGKPSRVDGSSNYDECREAKTRFRAKKLTHDRSPTGWRVIVSARKYQRRFSYRTWRTRRTRPKGERERRVRNTLYFILYTSISFIINDIHCRASRRECSSCTTFSRPTDNNNNTRDKRRFCSTLIFGSAGFLPLENFPRPIFHFDVLFRDRTRYIRN